MSRLVCLPIEPVYLIHSVFRLKLKKNVFPFSPSIICYNAYFAPVKMPELPPKAGLHERDVGVSGEGSRRTQKRVHRSDAHIERKEEG